jgi:hypothetical protein
MENGNCRYAFNAEELLNTTSQLIDANMRFPFSLPTNKPFDAVGFGLNAVDHLIVVPKYPSFDTKTRLLSHKLSAGGQTATAMVSLQRLGFKTAYAGRFGSRSGRSIRFENFAGRRCKH